MSKTKHQFRKNEVVLMHGKVVRVIKVWSGGLIVGKDNDANIYSEDCSQVKYLQKLS